MSGKVGDNLFRASGVVAAVAGGVSWQDVETGATFTAVAGNGYPVNTTSNACTATLPTSAEVGDEIIFTDYLRTWATNNLTLAQGDLKFQGYSDSITEPVYSTNGQSVHIVYMDATQGWVPISDDDVTFETEPNTITYDCVAGGGGNAADGGYNREAGSGGGGFIASNFNGSSGVAYTVTVGGGASGHANGTDSTITGSGLTTITAYGGGFGGNTDGMVGADGGSGGGNWYSAASEGGQGTADQGNDGGASGGSNNWSGGGGGGKGAEGTANDTNGVGGAGEASVITGTTYAAGGNGHRWQGYSYNASGAANTGIGATGIADGGSGIINLKILTADYTGTTTGSPTVTTDGDYTEMKFTGSGSYTA